MADVVAFPKKHPSQSPTPREPVCTIQIFSDGSSVANYNRLIDYPALYRALIDSMHRIVERERERQ